MSEQRITRGKVVSLTYTIRDENDEILEAIDIPVDYLHGGDSGLFEQVEQALEGKGAGDSIEVTVSAAEGFGEWDPALTYTDAIENVPPEFRRVGAKAEFNNAQGETITMEVKSVDQGTVTLDGNHPFAGKAMTFAVTVAAVRDATPEERMNGVAPPPRVH